MIAIHTTYDESLANIIKMELEKQGIQVVLLKQDVGGVRPSLGFVNPIQIQVPENMLETSMNLIKDLIA